MNYRCSHSWADVNLTLKVKCNSFSQNWWKVVSSCLLWYKPICVINFHKLRRKMLKSRSLLVFLYSYSLAHCHAWRHIRMFLFALLFRFDNKLFYRIFYYCNLPMHNENVTTPAIGVQSTLNTQLAVSLFVFLVWRHHLQSKKNHRVCTLFSKMSYFWCSSIFKQVWKLSSLL